MSSKLSQTKKEKKLTPKNNIPTTYDIPFLLFGSQDKATWFQIDIDVMRHRDNPNLPISHMSNMYEKVNYFMIQIGERFVHLTNSNK